jgi:glutaredoxin
MITIYSTPTCPKCRILKNKFDEFGIEYVECQDVDVMQDKGFVSVPMIDMDGNIMNFADAIKWINEMKG